MYIPSHPKGLWAAYNNKVSICNTLLTLHVIKNPLGDKVQIFNRNITCFL